MLRKGVSYYGNRILRHVKEDMNEIVKSHCNFVVHTFCENDLQFYLETMKEAVKMSHDAGLEVYIDPWGVGGIFGGESYSNHALSNIPALQVTNKGRVVPAVCLNNPIFTKFIIEWIDAALYTGADVVFWDEPHFYNHLTDENEWSCRCRLCKEKFFGRFKYEMPLELTPDLILFREDSIMNFIKMVCGKVHEAGKKNCVCVLPHPGHSSGTDDWSKIAALKEIDIIGTDPYWVKRVVHLDVEDTVRPMAKKIFNLAGQFKKENQLWIQGFYIPEGSEKEVQTAIEIAYQEGIRNIAVWSYYGGADMSFLQSKNQGLVWKIVGDAFKKLT